MLRLRAYQPEFAGASMKSKPYTLHAPVPGTATRIGKMSDTAAAQRADGARSGPAAKLGARFDGAHSGQLCATVQRLHIAPAVTDRVHEDIFEIGARRHYLVVFGYEYAIETRIIGAPHSFSADRRHPWLLDDRAHHPDDVVSATCWKNPLDDTPAR